MTPGKSLLSEGKLFDYTTMRSREHYITDHMIESCSVAIHTKRHRKLSGKLTMVCAKLTNSDRNWEIDFKDLVTTGQRWFLTLSLMLIGVMPIRSTVSSCTKHRTSSPNIFFMAIWDVRNRRHRAHYPSNIQRTSIHSSNNWLLFKMGESYPLEGSKDIQHGQVHQVSRPIPFWQARTNHPR